MAEDERDVVPAEEASLGLDCRETVHRLYHYLDGELTDLRRNQIVRHLDDCSPCLQAFDFEAELRKVVASHCKDHVPDHLRERIAAAIDHEHRRREEQPGPDDRLAAPEA